MLPVDVGAAPAAATRLQGTSSSTAASARRDRPAHDAGPFGALVDQFADEPGPSSANGQKAARPAPRQAAPAPPVPTPADVAPAGETAQPTAAPAPWPDDLPAPIPTPAEAADESRTDLVAPDLLNPFERPVAMPVSASAPVTGSGPVAEIRVTAGTPIVPGTWHQPLDMPAADGAVAGDVAVTVPGHTRPAPAGLPVVPDVARQAVEAGREEPMPAGAASPEVLAALRAVRAAGERAPSDIGAAVSAAASDAASRAPQVPEPSSPREVAMAAVREALTQAADATRPSPSPSPAAGEARVVAPGTPQPAVAGADHRTPLAARVSAEAPTSAAAALAVPSAEMTAPVAAGNPVAAGDSEPDGAPVRIGRGKTAAAQQGQIAAFTGANAPAASPDEPLQAAPGRRETQADAQAPVARPTPRAAQAIAAFQAAAAIGAASRPAAVHAAVFADGVSSTPLLDAELPTQLIHAIRVQFDQGSGEARIRLNPGFLGGVTVGVQIDGASVTASLQAASADVREWMRTNESMLRQALADQGLQLDRLVIVDEDAPASGGDQDARPREEREQQAPRRQRRTADQGTFELVF